MTGSRDTIVTINTWKADGRYRERLSALTTGIGALRPGVVALQEAFFCESGDADTAGHLGHALDMETIFSPARGKARTLEGRPCRSFSGMALLSAAPWTEFHEVRLPCDLRDGERLAQVGVTRVAGQPVVVANVHLTHLPDATPLRRAQLEALWRLPLFGATRLPIIICGDFNTPSAETLLASVAREAGLDARDTWQAGNGTGDRATTLGGAPLDFIFTLAASPGGHPGFAGSHIALSRPDAHGVLASDHFAVVTRMVGVPAHV